MNYELAILYNFTGIIAKRGLALASFLVPINMLINKFGSAAVSPRTAARF
jgi:hypothetical protein